MTTKEEKFYKCSKWYHGTTLAGWKSICELGIMANYNIGTSLDFGNGFYLSNSIKNTERYVTNMMKYNSENEMNNDDTIPVIIEFEFVPYDLIQKNVLYKHFPEYNDEFANFVFDNRLNYKNIISHGYDITSGVTTDTKPTYLMQLYEIGQMSREEIIEEFKKGNSVRQLCLHKQEHCDILSPTNAYILGGKGLNIHDYSKNKKDS